jgi:hypothetical protein
MTTSSKYLVSIPITGAVHLEVEASSKSEAIERAWAMIHEGAANEPGANIEWAFHDEVTRGNVSHAFLNEVEAVKLEND